MAREAGEVRGSISAGIIVCSCSQRLLRQCQEDYWTGTETCSMCAAFILTYVSGSFHPKMKREMEIFFFFFLLKENHTPLFSHTCKHLYVRTARDVSSSVCS